MTKPTQSAYPTALDSSSTLFGDPIDKGEFTLATTINSGATSFVVNEAITAVNIPTFMSFATGEIVYIEAKDNGTKTFSSVTRGDPASGHNAGEIIRLSLVSDYIKQIKSALIKIETELGTLPKGGAATVKARLDAADALLTSEIQSHDHSGGSEGVVINADTVDSIHASASPVANKLLALNASAKLPASITGDADTVDTKHASDFQTAGFLTLAAGTYVTIASDAITVTSSYGKYSVNTEGSAAEDDLKTISGGTTGQVLILTAYNSGRRVTLKTGTGNIVLPDAADMDIPYNGTVMLWYDGSTWFLMGARNDTRYIKLVNKAGQALVEGDVMIIDPGNDKACTTTTTASDPRVFCVAAHAIASNAYGNFIYSGMAKVNTTGTVNRGEALVTSTAAKLAKAMPGSNQQGLLGYTLTASSGNQCTAYICPRLDRAGSAVAFEGYTVLASGVAGNSLSGMSGTLVCGTNANRLVICLGQAGNYYGVSGVTTPTIGGVNMTVGVSAANSTYSRDASNQVQRAMWYMVNPPSGTQNITSGGTISGDVNGTGAGYIFLAFSGVNQSTPLRTSVWSVLTTSTPYISATDAVAGDLVLAGTMIFGDGAASYYATARGSGQTQRGYGGGAYSGNRNDTWLDFDTEVAASGTEQSTFTLAGSTIQQMYLVPIVPA